MTIFSKGGGTRFRRFYFCHNSTVTVCTENGT
nr:MAG TPA: hypothetical protein [Caudoviricetes sp.]